MSEQQASGQSVGAESRGGGRPPFLVALAIVLFLECALLAVATAFLLVELLTARPDSYASAIAILVLTAAAAVWMGITARYTLRGSPWTRAAATVWQLLQLGVAIGSFQGLFARADVGWLLVIPALVALLLLFTPSVVAATQRPDH